MTTVAVMDYGMGNLRSVSKALEHVGNGAHVMISHDAEEILRADRVVLPGVGGLRDCISELQRLELIDVIRECVRTKPFLGICLGMQALMESSDENQGTEALGIIPGRVLHFANRLQDYVSDNSLKVPHMGWNHVHQQQDHKLWRGIDQDSRFYFVHSYYVEPSADDVIAGVTEYGFPFASVIARDNLFAVQFHPEKSQHDGLTLLANFMQWDGTA